MSIFQKIIIFLVIVVNFILLMIYIENKKEREQLESFTGWVTTNFYPPEYED